MSHSPLQLFRQFSNKHVLVSGQGPVTEIAKNLGFTNITTIEDLRSAFPSLDMVDHRRRIYLVCLCFVYTINQNRKYTCRLLVLFAGHAVRLISFC